MTLKDEPSRLEGIQYTTGKGKPLQYSCLENPLDSMKRQKDMTLKDEPPGCPKSYWERAEGSY